MIDPDFLMKLNHFLVDHPASDTRWFSTPARNQAIGGAPDSAHLLAHGNAVDLVFDSDLELMAGAAYAQTCGFSGIELDLTNKHLHLDTKPRFWHVVHHGPGQESPLDEWLQRTYPNLVTPARHET